MMRTTATLGVRAMHRAGWRTKVRMLRLVPDMGDVSGQPTADPLAGATSRSQGQIHQ